MGIVNYTYNRSTSGGEIIRELVNSTDGQGLHFDGSTGNIHLDPPPDLGTKFSMEFIIQADSYTLFTDGSVRIIDFGTGGRFLFGWWSGKSNNLSIYSVATWSSFEVKVLDDLKVHHLVVTVDGTAATLYDNGNEVATATIALPTDLDDCTDARIGSEYNNATNPFNGTIYRARLWNKTLSQAEVTDAYENATVPFSDQWGSQTIVIPGDFTGNLDGWDAYNDWNIQTNPSNNMVLAADAVGQHCRNSATMTDGKRYRCTYTASAITGSPYFAHNRGSVAAISADADVGTGSSTIEAGTGKYFEFTQTGTGGNGYAYIKAAGATDAVTLDDISIVEIGVVSDYDLAFANPTQSDQVQDRAGAADGTASSGVTQVTPIEQLNAKALAVGTAAVTPGDAQVHIKGADGAYGFIHEDATGVKTSTYSNGSTGFIGTQSSHPLSLMVAGSGKVTISSAGQVLVGSGATTEKVTKLGGGAEGITVGAALPCIALWDTDHADYVTYLGNAGGNAHLGTATASPIYFQPNGVTKVTINSSGQVSIGGAAAASSNLQVHEAGSGDCLIVVSNDTTTVGDTRGFAIGLEADEGAVLMQREADRLNLGTSGVARINIAADGLTTVYKPGWPLKNELTNSGFDVWSNSTLENATGTDLTTNGSFASDASWTKDAGWTITGGNAVATNAAEWAQCYQTITGLTIGKLYKMSFTVNGFTDGSADGYFAVSGGTAGVRTPTLTGTGTASVVVEATATSMYCSVTSRTAGSDFTVSEVTAYEVTPGCVDSSNNLAWDGGYVRDTTLDCWRQHNDGGTNTKDGSFYSLKTTTGASSDWFYWPSYSDKLDFVQRFAGRTVTLGCWVKTATASHAEIKIYDSAGNSPSGAHTGGGDWEWLEVTRTVSATTTQFYLNFNLYQSGATAYFSQPMLCLNCTAIGEGNYSRPQGEVVWFEKTLGINLTDFDGGTVSSDTAINLESQSSGRIPKGAKAVHYTAYGKCATAEKWISISKSTSDYGSFVYSQVASKLLGWGDFVSCDSNGNIAVRRNDTFSEVTIKVDAVTLR